MSLLSKTALSDLSRQNACKKLCAFCYKNTTEGSAKNDAGSKPWENSDIFSTNNNLPNFYRILESFSDDDEKIAHVLDLKDKRNLSVYLMEDVKELFNCCDSCGVIVNSFCDVHHQFKSLKMQLEWKLDSLVSIMELADKVPSRIENLNRLFQGEVDTVEVAEDVQLEDESQSTRSTNTPRRFKLEKFKTLRFDMVKAGASKLSKTQPSDKCPCPDLPVLPASSNYIAKEAVAKETQISISPKKTTQLKSPRYSSYPKRRIQRNVSSSSTTSPVNVEEKKPFRCGYCQLSYKSYVSFRAHKRSQFHQISFKKQLLKNSSNASTKNAKKITKNDNYGKIKGGKYDILQRAIHNGLYIEP